MAQPATRRGTAGAELSIKILIVDDSHGIRHSILGSWRSMLPCTGLSRGKFAQRTRRLA